MLSRSEAQGGAGSQPIALGSLLAGRLILLFGIFLVLGFWDLGFQIVGTEQNGCHGSMGVVSRYFNYFKEKNQCFRSFYHLALMTFYVWF
jgi:hypothetical protein